VTGRYYPMAAGWGFVPPFCSGHFPKQRNLLFFFCCCFVRDRLCCSAVGCCAALAGFVWLFVLGWVAVAVLRSVGANLFYFIGLFVWGGLFFLG
jgi:hypothetical protein